MIGFIITAVVVYFVLRIIGFVLSCYETWKEIKETPPQLDIEALKKDLQDRTEDDLWELRNEYHSYLIESIDTPYYRFCLDIIGEIDKQIYALRENNRKNHALRE
ncbi:MAG: hypothetical protein Q4D11_01490 [Rhodospirillales bacterium]|nr:hypothetical protein [Rhodospirillales bacterium]